MAEHRSWFRFYTEFAFDPKVQLLSETLQRRFMMLLCCAAAGITPTTSVSQVNFVLRIPVSEIDETRSTLVAAGLIDDTWFPTNWDKRQYQSDSSTSRVQRFRKLKEERFNAVTETPSEQSRTEQSRTEQIRARATRLPDDFTLTPERVEIAKTEGCDPERTFAKFTDYWRAASGAKARKVDWDATWRNWCRNDHDRAPQGKAHKTKFELTQEALDRA